MRKFHFESICNVLPCELRLFWYSTRVLNRHLAHKLPTCSQQSADCWQKIFVKDGKRQSANSWPFIGQQLANCWPVHERGLIRQKHLKPPSHQSLPLRSCLPNKTSQGRGKEGMEKVHNHNMMKTNQEKDKK